MTKIMLVEDDNNLREIYEARLLAEGYEIVSAQDGEEALAMAVKEKPDLIIADVMMPKISGFDMLDILRSTPETRNTKVIMMTALSQAEDKERADKLGADRYLVKSQVTLEDVAKVAREVIGGETSPPAPTATPPAMPATPAPPAPPSPADPSVDPIPPASTSSTPVAIASLAPEPIATSTQTMAKSSSDEAKAIGANIEQFVAKPIVQPEPTPPVTMPADNPIATKAPKSNPKPVDANPSESTDEGGSVPIAHKKVIEPINDMAQTAPNLNELLAKEEQKPTVTPIVVTDIRTPEPIAESIIKPEGGTFTSSDAPETSSGIIHPSDPSNIAL